MCYAPVIQSEISRSVKQSVAAYLLVKAKVGAGEGNRTLVCVVESGAELRTVVGK